MYTNGSYRMIRIKNQVAEIQTSTHGSSGMTGICLRKITYKKQASRIIKINPTE